MFKKKNQDDAASATGAPVAVAPKEPLTEEQKKLRLQLGFIGVLAVIAAVIYVPGMLDNSKPTPAPAPAPAAETTTPQTPPAGETTPPEGETPAPAPAPAAAGIAATKAVQPVARFRQDPFTQFYSDVILPDPTPTPKPPVVLPPVELPTAPFQPGVSIASSGNGGSSSRVLVGLPSPRITRLSSRPTAPQVVTPPRISAGSGPASSGGASPSYNKRLSGFIIGDGVRALLEINKGAEIVTRVVQPGDEVDGIRILNIQRVTEGNRTITRMFITENGEERYVDLKAAPVRTDAAGAEPGGI